MKPLGETVRNPKKQIDGGKREKCHKELDLDLKHGMSYWS